MDFEWSSECLEPHSRRQWWRHLKHSLTSQLQLGKAYKEMLLRVSPWQEQRRKGIDAGQGGSNEEESGYQRGYYHRPSQLSISQIVAKSSEEQQEHQTLDDEED